MKQVAVHLNATFHNGEKFSTDILFEDYSTAHSWAQKISSWVNSCGVSLTAEVRPLYSTSHGELVIDGLLRRNCLQKVA